METGRLTGQVAVVTGGAVGIGGGISRHLAAAGAHVVVADIDAEAAEAARRDIATAGGQCTVVVGDIRDAERRSRTQPLELPIRASTSWSTTSAISARPPGRFCTAPRTSGSSCTSATCCMCCACATLCCRR